MTTEHSPEEPKSVVERIATILVASAERKGGDICLTDFSDAHRQELVREMVNYLFRLHEQFPESLSLLADYLEDPKKFAQENPTLSTNQLKKNLGGKRDIAIKLMLFGLLGNVNAGNMQNVLANPNSLHAILVHTLSPDLVKIYRHVQQHGLYLTQDQKVYMSGRGFDYRNDIIEDFIFEILEREISYKFGATAAADFEGNLVELTAEPAIVTEFRQRIFKLDQMVSELDHRRKSFEIFMQLVGALAELVIMGKRNVELTSTEIAGFGTILKDMLGIISELEPEDFNEMQETLNKVVPQQIDPRTYDAKTLLGSILIYMNSTI